MVRHFKLLILLLTATFLSFGQKPTVIGHWQPIKLQPRVVDSDTTLRFGDMILRKDFTFTIVGVETKNYKNILGWHVSESLNGKWKQEGKILYLYLKDSPFPEVLHIRRLTKSELWLQGTFENSPLKKYKRHE